jgi:hypothetical protein
MSAHTWAPDTGAPAFITVPRIEPPAEISILTSETSPARTDNPLADPPA